MGRKTRPRCLTQYKVSRNCLREHILDPGLPLHGRAPSYGLHSCQEQGTGTSLTTTLVQCNRKLWRCPVDPLWLHVKWTTANQIKIAKNIHQFFLGKGSQPLLFLLCRAPASDRRVKTDSSGINRRLQLCHDGQVFYGETRVSCPEVSHPMWLSRLIFFWLVGPREEIGTSVMKALSYT